MVKRILDASKEDFEKMDKDTLIESIRATQGRTLMAEVVAKGPPLISGVTNAEVATAFGADLILLTHYYCKEPTINGLYKEIDEVKGLIGRPIGAFLVSPSAETRPDYVANQVNAKLAVEQGADFLYIGGHGEYGASDKSIISAVKEVRKAVGEKTVIFAGKSPHIQEALDPSLIEGYVDAGSDGVIVPSPGVYPGYTIDTVHELVGIIRKNGALSLAWLDASIEATDECTIRQIALNNKMVGADIHIIGDAGFSGMSLPENIMAYSIAIRGKTHTYRKMALR